MWPFKKRKAEPTALKKLRYVTLYSADTPRERAEKIFRILGLANDRFGWTDQTAAILADYQRMDKEAQP